MQRQALLELTTVLMQPETTLEPLRTHRTLLQLTAAWNPATWTLESNPRPILSGLESGQLSKTPRAELVQGHRQRMPRMARLSMTLDNRSERTAPRLRRRRRA